MIPLPAQRNFHQVDEVMSSSYDRKDRPIVQIKIQKEKQQCSMNENMQIQINRSAFTISFIFYPFFRLHNKITKKMSQYQQEQTTHDNRPICC